MSSALQSYNQYIVTLENLLSKSAKQKNPAMWLHKNNARTIVFMLEGLARMYKTMHNKKRFTKMQDVLKRLEDSLGAVDYFVAMLTYCQQNKNIPKDIIAYFEEEVENTCDALNAYLADSFYQKNAGFEKMKEKVASADWMDDERATLAIRSYYSVQIDKLNLWMDENDGGFTSVEEQVHELRRKLRWLSILPQALNGKVQLQNPKTTVAKYKKYLTKDIITSPFNKLPAKGKLKSVVLLNKNAFYALSFMIDRLGKLKDQGLTQNALAIAYANIHLSNQIEADKITSAYIKNYIPINKILNEANRISATYFKENMLASLLKF